jgi:hypothetical protein
MPPQVCDKRTPEGAAEPWGRQPLCGWSWADGFVAVQGSDATTAAHRTDADNQNQIKPDL